MDEVVLNISCHFDFFELISLSIDAGVNAYDISVDEIFLIFKYDQYILAVFIITSIKA